MHTISPQKNPQSGAVLITSLVMLVILTLLGLSTISTSTLEEKMAANSQEMNRAFQTAETGLQMVMADAAAFSTSNTVNDNSTPNDDTDDIYQYQITDDSFSSYGAETIYRSEFKQRTPPSRESGWDIGQYAFYYFDLSATGSTPSGAYSEVHSGVYQIGPK